MDIDIPITIFTVYVVIALIIQGGVDTLYTIKMINEKPFKRFLVLLLASAIGYIVSILIAFVLYPHNEQFLINARNEMTYFALAVLAVVIEYVLFGAIYAVIKGFIIRWILLEDADEEKLGKWWGYNNLGTVTSLVLLAPIFFITYLLPALVGSVESG